MKFRYNKEDDVLIIELNKDKIDYAEQTGDLIVHFSPKRKAVLLEILDASCFIQQAVTKFPRNVLETIIPPSYTSIAHKVK